MKELILGGARSGKSRLAEERALASGLAVTLIVTATGDDEEMRRRILHHQSRRPADWTVVEEPLALAAAMRAHATPECCLVVDCLTLWLTNLLCAADPQHLQSECKALLEALPELPGQIILVGNETGMGIMPLGELTRRFCDESGRLHQELARLCDRVVLTVAGLPLVLK